MTGFQLDFEKPLIKLKHRINELEYAQSKEGLDNSSQIQKLQEELLRKQKETFASLTRWQRVQLARHPKRPYSMDYIKNILSGFIELHGDRNYRDDNALIAGFAEFDGIPIAVLGQQKGRETKERIHRNFGMMHPEGYRKALRIMKLAEKFSMPIIVFIDTPGAYPGIGAEERGQAEAIARNLFEMAKLETPIVCTIIGEGASGGALGIGLGDRILIMENAWYSVITPEGCAAILWRDRKQAPKAAETLKLTSTDLLELGMVDEIIPEPPGAAHWNPEETYDITKKYIKKHLVEIISTDIEKLKINRLEKYSQMGEYRVIE
ncbi:MAG: acetyl-CoA carboxylase carboxyltransferase subunit alpha [Candidatus Zixiibacteriota bacterium]